MDIEQKLGLSARLGAITFIQEGMFLRCYQQSLFSLQYYYQPGFKVLGKRIKKLQNLAIFYSGFPVSQIGRFLNARATDWGAYQRKLPGSQHTISKTNKLNENI